MKEPVLKIRNVFREYRDEYNRENSVQALQDINLEVCSGEFLSIIGSSGCGKTTLLESVVRIA